LVARRSSTNPLRTIRFEPLVLDLDHRLVALGGEAGVCVLPPDPDLLVE
jgi:hypothetical protein